MLIQSKLVTEIQKSFTILNSWNCTTFQYPYALSSHTLCSPQKFSTNPKFFQLHWFFQLLILISFTVFQFIYLICNHSPFYEIAVRVLVGSLFFLMCFTVYFHYSRGHNFIEFLNQLLAFETRHATSIRRNSIGENIWLNRISWLISLANIVNSLVFALSCALFPMAPWNPFKMFCRKASDLTRLWMPLVTFVYTYMSMRVITNFATISILLNLLISPFCLSSTLSVFKCKMKFVRSTSQFLELMQLYREIQILTGIYNGIHRTSLLPVYISIAIMCFSGAIYVLVAGYQQMDILAKIIFSNGLLMGVMIIIVCLRYPVKLNCGSRGILKTLVVALRIVKDGNLLSPAQLQKHRVSLRYVRISFLHCNFIDRYTPFVLFHFSLRTAIKLMLVDK